MAIDYKYMKEGGFVVTCAFCDAEAPLHPFERHGQRNEPAPDALLCQVCASTDAGNAQQYPEQFEGERHTLRTIAYCTNMILDAVTKRREGHPGGD